jgi:predicted nucleotidyltransferase
LFSLGKIICIDKYLKGVTILAHMLQNSNTWKIASIFFKEPTTNHNLKEICKKTNLAHTTTTRELQKLQKTQIINKKNVMKGKRSFPEYQANTDNHNYKHYKQLHNIEQLHATNTINKLYDQLSPTAIVLFGSYAKGEDIETSDIDLYIQCPKEHINLAEEEQQLQRSVQLHFNTDFKTYPSELKNNIINGITLKGQIIVW